MGKRELNTKGKWRSVGCCPRAVFECAWRHLVWLNSEFRFQYRDVKFSNISFKNQFVREQRHSKTEVSLYFNLDLVSSTNTHQKNYKNIYNKHDIFQY